MKLHFFTFEVQGQLSKVSKAKNFGDLYFHENTLQAAQKNSTVNIIQLKYDVSYKKLHFFTFEVQGQLSKEKQKISVTSMTLHFITFEVKGPRSISKVNYPKYIKQKISVTSMKLHFITFEVKGPRSISKVNYPKYLKQKISVTSMKLHFITFEVKGPRSISKVNYPKYLKQKISVTSMKLHFITFEVQGQLSKEKQKISVKGPRSISKVNYHFEPPPAISSPSSLLIWAFVFSCSNSISFTLQIYWQILLHKTWHTH